jgi:acetoin utilization deacetylase AcuC-like enzyme
MQTAYLYDSVFLLHTQRNHPENSARLEAIMALLRQYGVLDQVATLPFTSATEEQLGVVHDPSYVSALKRLCERNGGMLGLDTYVNHASYEVAALAAGAAIAATQAVLHDDVRRTFALVRPPGHHAFADHGEGFCLFNNVAFAARYALGDLDGLPGAVTTSPHVKRVMIVDWDVHHGNGTEDIFYADPRVLYVSTHEYQWPMYPGTGRLEEIGEGAGRGANVNLPLPPGVGDDGYAQVFDEVIVPLAQRFRPELLVISAGYDAHWRDMLAHMSVSLTGFARMVATLVNLSNELCDGRMVVVLEGGYDLEVLSYGVMNTLHILRGHPESAIDPIGPCVGPQWRCETPVDEVVARARQVHGLHSL